MVTPSPPPRRSLLLHFPPQYTTRVNIFGSAFARHRLKRFTETTTIVSSRTQNGSFSSGTSRRMLTRTSCRKLVVIFPSLPEISVGGRPNVRQRISLALDGFADWFSQGQNLSGPRRDIAPNDRRALHGTDCPRNCPSLATPARNGKLTARRISLFTYFAPLMEPTTCRNPSVASLRSLCLNVNCGNYHSGSD